LDDYAFDRDIEPFLPYVSMVKIDVLDFTPDGLEKHMETANLAGKTLLAEKIEDSAMYARCKALGFDLFQGYYLEKPTLVEGKKLATSQQTMLNLVSNLCRDDITVSEVAELITTDPHLIVKLLKIVNCPLFPFKREITDIEEAVIKLGIVVVKQWAVILSLVANSSQPSELFRTLLIRAKTCELYAKLLKRDNPQESFIIGLFSGIDAVLGIDKETVLNTVYFPEHMKQELIQTGKGKVGVLSMVMAFEDRIKAEDQHILSTDTAINLNDAYWSGVMWADEIMHFLT
jgi:EAL and modified HD-GYP domain-containing signal transduction protein